MRLSVAAYRAARMTRLKNVGTEGVYEAPVALG
jgi:hypothetical protein